MIVARYWFLTHSFANKKGGGEAGRNQKLYMLSSIMIVPTTLSLSRCVYDKLLDKQISMV